MIWIDLKRQERLFLRVDRILIGVVLGVLDKFIDETRFFRK